MTWRKRIFRTWPLVFVICGGFVFAGCEGTDSREAADETIKELAGQKDIERMDKMKKDLEDANQQHVDRLKKLQ